MELFLNILVFIVVLGAIVVIHELGHFFTAKKFNILCHEFAIGMGPTLVKKKKGETVYALRAIPIGGFVSMAGEDLNEAMIKKDQFVGLNLNDDGDIKEIVIDKAKEAAIDGRVVSYELYGADMAQLFIELDINGEIKKFNCLRNAMYAYGKKIIQVTPAERSFEHQKKWKRFIVLFAGAGMNFVLAFLLFLLAAGIVGKPQTDTATIGTLAKEMPASSIIKEGDVITEIGGLLVEKWEDVGTHFYKFAGARNIEIKFTRDGVLHTEHISPRIDLNSIGISNFGEDKVVRTGTTIGSVFAKADQEKKLAVEDKIKSFIYDEDGIKKELYVNDWKEITDFIKEYNQSSVSIKIERGGEELIQENCTVWLDETLKSQNVPKIQSVIGVSPIHKFDFFYMFQSAGIQFADNSLVIFRTLGMLFSNSQIGVSDLSGPVGIFNITGQVMEGGFLAVIAFMGLLSVNVGIMNLLPIPAFDGGRILFLGIEAVRRKPMNKRVENTINNVMFIVLMLFLVFITVMDVFRLF